MSLRFHFVALVLGALLCGTSANAAPISDPRIAIDAVNTPGDAQSLFRISEPGSYYLPGNVQGVAGKSGIDIAASEVHVDLMGYGMVGAHDSSDAIRVVHIRVQGGSRIEDNDIRSHTTGFGVRAFGTGSYVVKNTLTGNLSTLQVPNSGNFVGTLVHVNGMNGRNDPWANLHSN